MTKITLRVNGQNHTVAVDDPNIPLLYAPRDDPGLRGPNFSCGLGPGERLDSTRSWSLP
jgi:nicotinate dehydrogenase subunit A